MKTVTPQMEQELFERGLVIRRAWIMPPGQWEYYVARVGDIRSPSIAIRTTRVAAYNAAIRWLATEAAQRAQPARGQTAEEGRMK
ncbi:MAG TPA: hypothetical protein VFU31_27840 [Candidatus Binatia bacterium]|nr:hypothetical protein [Candidatus Binatia bacterium]